MILLFCFLVGSLIANVIMMCVLNSTSSPETPDLNVDILKSEICHLRVQNQHLKKSVEEYAACNDKLELQFKQKFCCHPPRFVNWSQAPHEIRCGLCNVRVEIRAKTDEQTV